MNNDALLTLGAVENMQKAAYELPDCGIIVPQQILPGGTKTIDTHVPFAYPQYDCDVNLSAAHKNVINIPLFHSGRVVELNFAPFFCVYIKRDILDSSVGLDAEYGRHYRSDRRFCNYIRHMMNLKIYYIEKLLYIINCKNLLFHFPIIKIEIRFLILCTKRTNGILNWQLNLVIKVHHGIFKKYEPILSFLRYSNRLNF